MSARVNRFCVSAVMLAVFCGTSAPAAAQNSAVLGWMTGCWAAQGGEPGSGEVWTTATAGSLFGVSRTVKGGKTVAWEYMQIRDEADGTYFVARPSGQAEGRFKAVTVTGARAVFENPAHDFPTRVIYERRPDGTMLGRIEGTRNSRPVVVDFPFVRTPCQ